MAISSITANFHTDDAKAVNAFSRTLFTNVKPSSNLPTAVGSVREYTPAQERTFWSHFEKVCKIDPILRHNRNLITFTTCYGKFA